MKTSRRSQRWEGRSQKSWPRGADDAPDEAKGFPTPAPAAPACEQDGCNNQATHMAEGGLYLCDAPEHYLPRDRIAQNVMAGALMALLIVCALIVAGRAA